MKTRLVLKLCELAKLNYFQSFCVYMVTDMLLNTEQNRTSQIKYIVKASVTRRSA